MDFKILAFIIFLMGSSYGSKAQIGIVNREAEFKPTLMVLGTYHMGTPGNNVINTKYEDVTNPSRQKQMIELVEKLEKFKPTKIAVECDIEDNERIQEMYTQYLAGNYQLSKNETNQIGFRLGKALGHEKIYCVDWGIFPDDPLYNYETYASSDEELDKFLKEIRQVALKNAAVEKERLFKLPIIDQLIYFNNQEHIDNSHQGYFDIMRIGKENEYVGANYLSWWYGRNMKILMNIIRITDSMNDRILVIYGEGHLKLLTQLAQESGFYIVENPLNYLQR